MSKKPSEVVVRSVNKASSGESSSKSGERLKVVIAFLALLAGIVGYYHFSMSDKLFAFGSLFAGSVVFLGAFFLSDLGKRLVVFFKEARVELRKVVWPSMDETKKMTLIVLFVMALVLIYLVIVDGILKRLVDYILSFSI